MAGPCRGDRQPVRRDFDGRPFSRETRSISYERAAHDSVKCLSLKLSQGAKPGIGGVLPGNKVTAEIAEARSVPAGEKCVSPECPVGVATQDPRRAHMLRWMIGHTDIRSYADLYEWLEPGQLLREAPESRTADWVHADPDRFRP